MWSRCSTSASKRAASVSAGYSAPGGLAQRVAEGIRASWETLANNIDGGEVLRLDGLLLALTNLPDPTLNVAYVERPPEDPDAAIAEARRVFAERGLRLGIDFEAGTHPAVRDAAERAGLSVVDTRPAMARTLRDLPPLVLPPDISIRRVKDEWSRRATMEIQTLAFSMRPEVAERYFSRGLLSALAVRVYIAWLRTTPVASAIAYLHDGMVGLVGIGTAPWATRRGIGSAITLHALQEAGDVADLAWLQATPEGRPLYERLGFELASEWIVLVDTSTAVAP